MTTQVQQNKFSAPVTAADIEAAIDSEHYFTALQGARMSGIDAMEDPCGILPQPLRPELGMITFCVLVLRNGFTVTGESFCAIPENFDAKTGRDAARKVAVEKIWSLQNYLRKWVVSQK